MNKEYIRHPLLSGYRVISGIWLPCDWFDESMRVNLLIKYWQTGCQAYRFDEGDLLCFAESKAIDCALLDGWPLTLYGNTYSSAPLDPDEIKRLPLADAWVIRNGLVIALSFSHAQPISLSDYIDLDEYSFQQSDDYSELFIIEVNPDNLIEKDVRKVIGENIPKASQAQQQFLQTLKAHENKSRYETNIAESSKTGKTSFMHRILSRLISSKTRDAINDNNNSQAIEQLPKLQRWLAKLAMESGLASLIGKQHANYINKMMKMFEENNIEQALRHGIPLSKNQDFSDPPPSPYLGFLQRRNSLEILSNNQVSKGIYLGEEAQQYLKQLYRKQFIQLDKAGRNDEALFILAELLQEYDEALDYLERFERYQQAAELAHLWSMSPERITRLHCLSGDVDAAINYARLHHTFSSVILQLQEKHPDIATRMRKEWAESLADRR
ncbi:bpX6 domain-containing protein [Providencia sneebia]|uniref:bpX6 domain-containing protein n=1 Tax=Providencia sneebia TaxID=516075 RepID=UPI0005C64EFD